MRITQLINLFLFLVTILRGVVIQAQTKEDKVKANQDAWYLHLHTLSFIKNNEYFGPLVEGHTVAGHHLYPYVCYTTSINIITKWGLFLRRDWAAMNLFSHVVPTFTLQYGKQPYTLAIGTLEGGHTHRLVRPLYDIERTLLDMPETGLRMCHINKYIFLDIWLHWLTLLNRSNHVPEELVAGLSYEQRITNLRTMNIRIPMQLILYHLGGQGIPIQDYTLWLGALGGAMAFQLPDKGFLKSLEWEMYYVGSCYIKKVPRPFKTGHGFYGQITFNTSWFKLQGSYWNAYGFSSENLGHPLYQSISILNKQVKHQEKHRQLFFLHLHYNYRLLQELEVSLYIDPYYDINHHIWEHEAGLYVRYTPSFKLSKPAREDTNNLA